MPEQFDPQSEHETQADGAPQAQEAESTVAPKRAKGLSLTHLFLATNTVAIGALVFFVAYLPMRRSADAHQGELKIPPAALAKKPHAAPKAVSIPEDKTETVSWANARNAFAKKEYAAAFRHYSVLYKITQNSPTPDPAGELFHIRMAQCLQQLAKPLEAQKLYQSALASKSPVIRGVANYHLAVCEEAEGLYLRASRRAYLASAALAGLSRPVALEKNCDFLVARTVTRKALSFYGKDEMIRWEPIVGSDPFVGLDQTELRKLLNDARTESGQASLGPNIRPSDRQGHINRWDADSFRAPLSEFLARFATIARTDLQWVSVAPAVRNRPISLQVRGVSGQRLGNLAVGSAGLIARFTGEQIQIYDPAACESLNQQRDLLVSEAAFVWRRLFLRAPADRRIAEGHFSIALLQACSGDIVGAIEGYRSMAHNFSNARLAPAALLEGAKLRIELRDYTGARKELLTLLDTYPGDADSASAYACLGQATMHEGKPDEAFAVFRKLFFMSESTHSKMLACFGAGKSLHKQGKYDAAVKWLEKYLAMATKAGSGDTSQAYLLLGRCRVVLGHTDKAVEAFGAVMAASPKNDERMEAGLALAGAWRGAGDLTRALAMSLHLNKDAETDQQKYQSLQTAAGVYRDMGLPEIGAALLKGKLLSVSDPAIRAKLRIEQARCYRDAKRYALAYAILTEAPKKLLPGIEARRAACDLAEVCLRTARPAQAALVAGGVLKSSSTGPCRRRARKLLAEAYLAKREYDNAATTLSDMPLDQLGAKQK
jgi:tetratricopeptide (TPR) repeat protein